LVDHPGDWKADQPVELVVRAQRFKIYPRGEGPDEEEVNTFHGKIKERSYMGGEVSYFINLDTGTEVHVISMMRTIPFKIGDELTIVVPPHHCGLLPRKEAA
jgi:putative spermidine/putrescine transport system ATP-binding protein/spermidine/putrescine transport system ATP-binding protein